jgi:uncharacterized membrane protein
LAGVTFHQCLFGGAYRACLATAHWRDHHICTQEIDLKTFLIVALVFGFPFLFFVIAGVVGLFRGY